MRIGFLRLLLAFSLAAVVAKPEDLPRGQVIPRVACAGVPDQTYALYLPANYDPSKKWSAIFAFDPMAEGIEPAKLLAPAAERYGFIVIASNNSRNGPLAVVVEAMQALWADSRQRFSINDQQVYSAGFSGGARAAFRFALALPNSVRGVIPVAGGLPLDVEVKKPPSFAIYGIVGIRDLNYHEMTELDRKWAAWGLPHHLEVTGDKHRWASEESLTRALGWMELQGMKSGTIAPDPEMLSLLLAGRLDRVRELEKRGRIVVAFGECESILEDFRGMREVFEVERMRSEIQSAADFEKIRKTENKREENRERLDLIYTSRLATVEANLSNPPSDPAALEQAIAALGIETLRKDAANCKEDDRGIVADRQMQRILISMYEDAQMFFSQNLAARALVSLEVAAAVRPDSPEIQFLVARAAALSRDNRKALRALAKAAELGFSSAERIESEPAFAPLRPDPSYTETVAKIRARSESGNR